MSGEFSVIEVVNLTQHYGVKPVLKEISLSFAAGEIAVIVGPNGMGKSTLLASMAGILSPQEGYVQIGGWVRRSSPEDENHIRRITIYLPDDAWLPNNCTLREFLLAVAGIYVAPDRQRGIFEELDKLLDLFDLKELQDSLITRLSSGQKKKVALISAIIADTQVLLLDEPFSGGLDPSGILVLKRLLKNLAKRNKTVVLTSPVPELIEEVADKIVILKDGRVVAHDTLEGLKRQNPGTDTLAAILERMLYSDTVKKIDAYFEGGSR